MTYHLISNPKQYVPTKTLVTGASGLVGRSLRLVVKQLGWDAHFRFASKDDLDIANTNAVQAMLNSVKPRWVINAAAYTKVDDAESNTDLAYLINETAAGALANMCASMNISLAHISTDYVFGGDLTHHTPYTEDVTPASINTYGKSKLAGENAVIDSGVDHIIIRTARILSLNANNFAHTIFSRLQNNMSVQVVDDQPGSPTSADDLAEIILMLITNPQSQLRGIANITNSGIASWYDIAFHINRIAGYNSTLVTACKTTDTNRAALRPVYSALDLSRLIETTNIKPRSWEDAVRDIVLTMLRSHRIR